MRKFLKILICILVIVILIFVVIEVLIIIFGIFLKFKKLDCIIVLGCVVYGDFLSLFF